MLSLKAEKRDIFGKELKKVRQAGKLPIVIYGSKEKSTPLFVAMGDFKKALNEAGESTVISLHTDDGEKDVLIHDVSYDPVSSEPIHADFYVVEKGQKVTVNVPLEFEGVSPAVKELGGVLIKVLHEIEIEAAPKDLPHDIKVDISKLVDLESVIVVGDLPIPAGVEVLSDKEEVVASIDVVQEEPEEPTEAPDLASIEVEKKGKKEEEGGEGETESKDQN